MATRRSSQLAIAFSPTFKRQTAWDTPLAGSELTVAFPATSRNWIDTEETVEDVYDCTDEDLLFENVTGRLARLTIDFDVDPDFLAGWAAFNYGVAAAPSGGTSEVQTETVTGTGGTRQFVFTRAYNRQVSAAVAYNANAAAVQAALEAMSNIGAGNVAVGQAGAGPYVNTITFQGELANEDVSLLESISAVTGPSAGVAIVQTTPGVGRTHAISRLGVGLYQLPFTTLYVGFRGSDKQPVIFKNVVCDVLRVRSTNREKVTATVQLIGSGDLQDAVGFTMPECLDIEPIRFGDCALTVNGSDLYDPDSVYAPGNDIAIIRDWEYYHQNDTLTGVHAFTGQGIDIGRLERANRRPSGLNFGVLGEKGDPLYDLAKATRPRAIVSASLRCGPTAKFVRFNVPQGILKHDAPAIRFEGDAGESVIRLIDRPKRVSGDSTTPSNITAVTTQDTAYLIAA
jgi:hypothetical protein